MKRITFKKDPLTSDFIPNETEIFEHQNFIFGFFYSSGESNIPKYKAWLQKMSFEQKIWKPLCIENGVRRCNGWSGTFGKNNLNEYCESYQDFFNWVNDPRWFMNNGKVFMFENEIELFKWLAKE